MKRVGPILCMLLLTSVLLIGAQGFWSKGSLAFDLQDPSILVSFALITCLFNLLICWGSSGHVRWPMRLTGALGGAALLLAYLMAGPGQQFMSEIIVVCLTNVVSLLILLKLGRQFGIILVAPAEAEPGKPPMPHNSRQYQILDVILWTVAASIMFAVLRHLEPKRLPSWLLQFLVTLGLGMTLVSVTTLWASLGRTRLVVRILLVWFAAPAGGLAHFLSTRGMPSALPWWWYTCLTALQAAYLVSIFLGFRALGYRIGRRAQ